MSKVFIVEPCKIDVSKAKDFGELRYLFDAGRRRSSIWRDEFRQEVLDALEREGYNPEVDYLLVAGNNVTVTIAVTTAVSAYGQVRALLFNATDRTYVTRHLGGCNGQQARETVHAG